MDGFKMIMYLLGLHSFVCGVRWGIVMRSKIFYLSLGCK